MRSGVEVDKCFPRVFKLEDSVDHWLQTSHGNGARDILQTVSIPHRNVAENGSAEFQLEEIDARIFRGQKADGSDLRPVPDGKEGLPDCRGPAHLHDAVHAPPARQGSYALTPEDYREGIFAYTRKRSRCGGKHNESLRN